MCTNIALSASVRGAGKAADGWFPLNKTIVGYDHTTHSADEHALLLDFVNYDIDNGHRVAVELDLESGRVLIDQLRAAIELAEASGVH